MLDKYGCLGWILLILFGMVLSWGITSFIIWLICLCFGWDFSLLIATGIWLVIYLIKQLF